MPFQALDAHKSPHLLARLLDTPNLPQVVRALDPQILHRIVRVFGLEDCGELVSLATPQQLMRVFDDDLWGSHRAGGMDRFDADRFGVWLEVLVESGASIAAEKLIGFDFDFVGIAVAEHLVVIDQRSEVASACLWQFVRDSQDDEQSERPTILEQSRENALSCEIGGYVVVAKRTDSWDALLAVAGALEAEHPDFLQRLLRRCATLSAREIDESGGLHHLLNAREQFQSDVAFDREQRREKQGYVTASQAVAFLQAARCLPLRAGAPPVRDHVTQAYFREIERQPSHRTERESSPPSHDSAPSSQWEPGVASFLETLREAGVVTEAPRGLLVGERAQEGSPLSAVTAHMQYVADHDEDAHARRHEELGYLANVLASGCSFNSGRFTHSDAQEAVIATCNLGLENWPHQWLQTPTARHARQPIDDGRTLPADFLLHHELVTVFQVGWTVLYEQVVACVTRRLMEILSEPSSGAGDVQDDLRQLHGWLRQYLKDGTPWRARDHLDVIAILDTPSWSMLLRLIDECPAVPTDAGQPRTAQRALRVSTEFGFISENRQIAWVRDFVERLPNALLS